MAKDIPFISDATDCKPIEPVRAVKYQIVGPWQMRARETAIGSIPAGCVLLRPVFVGICHADLRYISGSRPEHVLRERLPMAPFHEGVAEVVDVGDDVGGLHPGGLVSVVPNVPCYVQDPIRYASREHACPACRPGGAGENYCTDVAFLASNVDGLAQSLVLHPAAAVVPLPAEAPPRLAALAEPLSVVYRAGLAGELDEAHRVAVLGAGVMGYLMTLVLSQAWGFPRDQLLVTDVCPERLEPLAGLALTHEAKEGGLPDDLTAGFDRAFECAGGAASAATIGQILDLLTPGGRAVLVGVSEDPVPIRTRPMLDKGLALRGTTRSAKADFPPVLDLLRNADFRQRLERVIVRDTFEQRSVEAILAAARVAADPNRYGKVILDWTDASA